jgi:RND family efflux transporter MFP subunit
MMVQRSNRLALSVVSTLAALAGACESSKQAPPPRPPPDVSVSSVVEREILDYDEYSGRIQGFERVDVRAQVSGYLVEVAFEEGQEVKAGAALFKIDARPFQAELDRANAALAVASAEFDLAVAKLARMEEALKTNSISEVEVIEQRAQKAKAEASIAGAKADIEKAKLDVEFSTVVAPIDGKIGRALITKGNLVRAGPGVSDLLSTIERLDPIYIYFDVDERSLQRYIAAARKQKGIADGGHLPDIKSYAIPLFAGLASETGFPHQGVIDFADNKVTPTTGTVVLRGVLANEKRIFVPGYFTRVRIPSGDKYKALLVSERAIGTDQDQKYVLVVDDKNVVQKRMVKLGRLQDDGLRVIADGIRAGESVIVNGIQRARAGAPVTPSKVEMPRRGPAAAAAPAAVKTSDGNPPPAAGTSSEPSSGSSDKR